MKQNIGNVDALMRITCGLSALAFSTARLVKDPQNLTYLAAAACGAMKTGEGILKYCLVKDMVSGDQQTKVNNES